jgi:hypothetical protein
MVKCTEAGDGTVSDMYWRVQLKYIKNTNKAHRITRYKNIPCYICWLQKHKFVYHMLKSESMKFGSIYIGTSTRLTVYKQRK